MRNGILAALVLAVWCIFPAVTIAQSVASVTGTVTDTSGAAVADADVTLVNIRTNASYVAKTGGNGAYRIAGTAVDARSGKPLARTEVSIDLIEGKSVRDATLEASLLRLRPIMMTALVACLGLLPAAISTGVGSDTQKPFAIVVVAGLLSRLLLGFFVNPVLYELVAREGDILQV